MTLTNGSEGTTLNEWIITANQHYVDYAAEELRRILPSPVFRPLLPGETALMQCEIASEDIKSLIVSQEPIFLRHIQPVSWRLNTDQEWIVQLIKLLEDLPDLAGKKVAIHLRKVPGHQLVEETAAIKQQLVDKLVVLGAIPAQQDAELIIALYATGSEVLVGVDTPAAMLSDWPGGAVRLQREENLISRAKFKLVEAERSFGLDFSSFSNALDIGAAPGGWTSFLLEKGLSVTAVDPGAMHPSLLHNRKLKHVRANASDLKAPPASFDLLVCDMSWSPMQMARLVLDLESMLCAGASAVITIKLMKAKPLQTIREVTERLSQKFELQKAKQLFHNREEITIYLIKR